jgi:hypothetical protein
LVGNKTCPLFPRRSWRSENLALSWKVPIKKAFESFVHPRLLAQFWMPSRAKQFFSDLCRWNCYSLWNLVLQTLSYVKSIGDRNSNLILSPAKGNVLRNCPISPKVLMDRVAPFHTKVSRLFICSIF